MKTIKIRSQRWREYEFGGRTYRIDSPRLLKYAPGGKNHRVTDANGVTHIVPSPGFNGCVVRTS